MRERQHSRTRLLTGPQREREGEGERQKTRGLRGAKRTSLVAEIEMLTFHGIIDCGRARGAQRLALLLQLACLRRPGDLSLAPAQGQKGQTESGRVSRELESQCSSRSRAAKLLRGELHWRQVMGVRQRSCLLLLSFWLKQRQCLLHYSVGTQMQTHTNIYSFSLLYTKELMDHTAWHQWA